MTENQEKELFTTLATLVNGVNKIQIDVQEIREIVNEHSTILAEHSTILAEHSTILAEHSTILAKHSTILNRLDAKSDSIAETVINQEIRLTKVEKEVEELRSGVH